MSKTDIPVDFMAEVVSWRRHLHGHPELAFHEKDSSDFVASQLGHAGLGVHRGLGGTGIVGTLSRGASRRAIGIRADMDGLPICEESGVEYASRVPGAMHACGHDGHMAMLLAAARIAAALEGLDGTVHFIFQPAEEGARGAKRMIEDGLFQRFPCDFVFALHNWPAAPVNSIVVRDAAMMAAFAVFEIEIHGTGCHAGMPHEGADALLAGCHVVSGLQSIVSRNASPVESAVVSATEFRAGEACNAIPGLCVIRGTTRWLDDRVGDVLETRIGELTRSIAKGFGCDSKVKYERRAPATVNDGVAARMVRTVAGAMEPAVAVRDDVAPSMASEDFAFMLRAVPGCYFWLGSGGRHGLHSPSYDFNDELLPIGTALWVALIREALKSS